MALVNGKNKSKPVPSIFNQAHLKRTPMAPALIIQAAPCPESACPRPPGSFLQERLVRGTRETRIHGGWGEGGEGEAK